MLLILVFLSYVSDEPLKVAGGTVHFLECAKRWGENGVKIITLTTPFGARVLAKHGLHSDLITVSAVRETKTDTFSTVISYVSRCFSVVGIAPKAGDDGKVVILTESHFLPDIVAGLALRRSFRNANLVCYLHHLVPKPHVRLKYHPALPSISAWIAEQLSLFLMKICHFKIFTYPSNVDELTKKEFYPSEIFPMASGVDLTAAAAGKHGGDPIFDACYLGRLSPLKGVTELVAIWRLVCKKLPTAKLAIAGSGDDGYTSKIIDQVKHCEMEKNVCFLGWVSGLEKFRLLRSSKLLVSASREEGWGISICEAMACEVPVVAFDSRSYRWAFQKGIFLAPSGDMNAFAQIVTSLLTNDESRLFAGKQALEQSMKYDWNEIAKSEMLKISQMALEIDRKKGSESLKDAANLYHSDSAQCA